MSGDGSQKETTMTTASSACLSDDPQHVATLTKVGLTCPAENCSKTLKSKQTLGKHMDKFHAGVQQGVQHVKNFSSLQFQDHPRLLIFALQLILVHL